MVRRYLIAAALVAAPVQAEVVAVDDAGFEVVERIVIAAAPDAVFARLVEVGRWWDASHSYSGDAANISLDARPGGCWCEKIPPGGAIEHMRVVYVDPGKILRARGGLGPVQSEGADGALTWTLKAVEGGTELRQRYAVGGRVRGGFPAMAPLVDGVLKMQMGRIKRYVETGKPTA
jgi:Polyketide cyclase / dehydrase and lipid transport